MSGAHYQEMLRREVCRGASAEDAVSVGSASSGGERKRRRRNPAPPEGAIDVDSRSSSSSASDSKSTGDSDSDSDEFEDVEIDPQYPGDEAPITVTLGRGSASALEAAAAEARVRRNRPTLVSKDERRQRVVVHQGCVATMAAHGAMRNQWCNDAAVQRAAVQLVPPEARQLLVRQPRNDEVLDVVRSRRWLDGLRRAMAAYGQRFRRTTPGLARAGWGEAVPRGAAVTLERFRQLVAEARGSRDVGAQGFVAALRGIGVEARLVFLLQPPDFTSTKAAAPAAALPPQGVPEEPLVLQKAPSRSGGAGVQDSRRRMLGSLRSAAVAVAPARGRGPADAPFPVFWAEAWNRYSSKWVSIDPLTLRTLEVAPMRRRLAFEPPANEARVQLVYALAYDRRGGVSDVTRRYSHQYNAKTCRKRITRVDAAWYDRMLAAVAAPRRRVSRRDALELKEFHERDLAEGIPSNVGDFKNHPLYALELQLRQTEIIYPMDKTSQCGLFRAKSKRDVVVPIYKRLAVHQLRTARAWYMRGRILKVGVAPLKVRAAAAAATAASDGDGDGDDEVRLYADFQTTLYHPPPIVNGVVPKNAYGNVDIYVPSMVPAHGHLIRTDGRYTMKMAEQAAKYILGIDYARAVVGFDFGTGVAGKKRAAPTTREGGILIDEQYQEAMEVILENLVEQEEERQRDLVERNSLQNWKYFLAKLRISKRLEVEHGAVEPDPESASEASDSSDAYSVHSDTLGENARGGFVVDDYREVEQHPGGFVDEGPGGFDPASPKGGFERTDLTEQGGFVEDHHVEEALDDAFLDEVPGSYFHSNDRGELVYDPDVELLHLADKATPQMVANLAAKGTATRQMAANSPKLESGASANSSQSPQGSEVGSLPDGELEAGPSAAPDDEFGFEYESD